MNTIAPVWDGNETWLVLGGGGLLAAFPLAYARDAGALHAADPDAAGLILRGVAFEFRCAAAGAAAFLDRPSRAARWPPRSPRASARRLHPGHRPSRTALRRRPFDWLTPFTVLVGAGLVAGYALLGATWLVMKTDGIVQGRSYGQAFTLAILVAVGMGLISALDPADPPRRRRALVCGAQLRPAPARAARHDRSLGSTPAQHRRSPRDTPLSPQHGNVRAGLSRARRVDVALSGAAAPHDLGGGRTADLARLSAGRRGDPDPGDSVATPRTRIGCSAARSAGQRATIET